MEITEVTCKFCQSKHVIKYGHSKGVHNFLCKDCGSKFVDNNALPGMKTPTNQVSSAVSMYYEGMSLNAIRRLLYQEYNSLPSDSTVFEWVDHNTQEAISKTKDYKPSVSDVWCADETVLKIGGRNV